MKDSLDSVHVGVLGEQLVFQPLFQGRPLGGAVVLLNKDGLKRRFFFTQAGGRLPGYRGSFGEPVAVVGAPQPQHVLGAVEELGEAVKLAVAKVDGSLEDIDQSEFSVQPAGSSEPRPPGRLRPATWCRCGGPGRA